MIKQSKLQFEQQRELDLLKDQIKWAYQVVPGTQKFLLDISNFTTEHFNNLHKKIQKVELLQSRKRSDLQTLYELNGGDQELLKNLKINKATYRFSTTQKHKDISVQKDQMKAGGSYFALIDGPVVRKGSSIQFIINAVGTWTGIGMGLRSFIKKNYFDAKNWSSKGHGSFLLFDYAKVYSHSSKIHNDVSKGFKFSKGEVIRVTTNEDRLIFENETTETRFDLKISLSEDEWKDAVFCIYTTNGEVSILN